MKKIVLLSALIAVFSVIFASASPALAGSATDGGDTELAKKLTNPVADLMMIPVQVNYDHKIGVNDDGKMLQVNIQPVIPFHLNNDWNLITRTIVSVISQKDIAPGTGSQFGLGDVNMTLFFSPKSSSAGGIVWGVGPVFLLPTATDDLLGSEKWGAGPAGIILTMHGPWTIGMQANHIWSYAGSDDRSDISTSLIQPFVSHTVGAWTISLTAENTYNHKTEKWSAPVNFSVAKLVRWGKLPVSLQGGIGYWAESPDTGAEGFRFRFQAKFVLPRS